MPNVGRGVRGVGVGARGVERARKLAAKGGLFDYRLRVVARDIADFERVLRRRIMTLPGVGNVEANVLLTEERRAGPIG